jgi:alpha-L-fucosidase
LLTGYNGIKKGGHIMQTIYGLTPVGPAPTQRHIEWYRRERIAFIHFTVNTFTDLEWGDGTEKLSKFNPKELNTDQWCGALKNTGSKGIIITAKHHDGFCLFDTRHTDHNVMNTPFGKDIVKMLSESCKVFRIDAD